VRDVVGNDCSGEIGEAISGVNVVADIAGIKQQLAISVRGSGCFCGDFAVPGEDAREAA
jgi:hypothetical protein